MRDNGRRTRIADASARRSGRALVAVVEMKTTSAPTPRSGPERSSFLPQQSILLKTSSGTVVHLAVQHLLDDHPLLSHAVAAASITCNSRSASWSPRAWHEKMHEMVRQLANEPDRVGEQHVRVVAEIDFACQRIERGEESVLDEYVARSR